MKRSSLFVSVVALGMGTASMLRTHHQYHSPSPHEIVAQITNISGWVVFGTAFSPVRC